MGEKLEKDVLEMNNKIKEFSEYRKQENQKVQQDLENLKKDLQQSNGQVAEETEKQVQKITSLQEQNQELRNEIEQKRCKINELNTQLTRKNEALKKTHKKLEDERKNRKEVELKLEAVRILHKGKKKAMEEVRELSKKLNKHGMHMGSIRMQTLRHMWIEFVGSLLCSERFGEEGTLVFPVHKNQYLIWLEFISWMFPISALVLNSLTLK